VRTRLLRARQAELERKVRERTAQLEALHLALKDKSLILERSSITDPLTGLHNRRFLTEHIEQDIAASLRRAQETRAAGGLPADTDSVFYLVDADHFKRVNDLHGHAAGDRVLQQLAQVLRRACRETDTLVRWGGEEFLAVARDTDRQRAEELAERIRSVISEAPFQLDDGTLLPITCSVGFACLPYLPRRPHALNWQDVVRLADLGLLTAKRAGRDCWVGLHATETARPEMLQASAQAAPLQALQQGEMRASSNRPLHEVLQALAPAQGQAAPWPFTPAPTAG
jgi:diguanylate cyclase (GGDEF)-like protein